MLQLLSNVPNAEEYTQFLQHPKENHEGHSGLVNDLTRTVVPAFISIVQCKQSQGNVWRFD
jgi:hypothetical protein